MQYWDIPSPHFFLVTFQVGGLQVSAQTEHSAMWSSWAKKSSLWTRNGNAYSGKRVRTEENTKAEVRSSAHTAPRLRNNWKLVCTPRNYLVLRIKHLQSEGPSFCLIFKAFLLTFKLSTNLHFCKKYLDKLDFFTSVQVFVFFNSTKMNSREKKQNKQDLFFILHQKSSKSI